jgi:hypothetical protein
MTGRLSKVSNRHGASSGEAPEIDGDERGAYVGYFENALGEQHVYVCDRATGVATVRTGDAGWAHAYEVVSGRVLGLLLGEAEALWVPACWMVTGEREG